jgi:hypothetical protein
MTTQNEYRLALNSWERESVYVSELGAKWARLMTEGRRAEAAAIARELRDLARDLVAVSRNR